MANPGGHPATLRHDSEAQAARRVVHRAYSPRLLAPRARELADALLALPHVQPIDQLAAEEIGALVARIDAVDAALDARQVGTKGTATLMDLRLRFSSRLERWLAAFGATPAARADWAARLAQGGLADEIRRRRAEREGNGA